MCVFVFSGGAATWLSLNYFPRLGTPSFNWSFAQLQVSKFSNSPSQIRQQFMAEVFVWVFLKVFFGERKNLIQQGSLFLQTSLKAFPSVAQVTPCLYLSKLKGSEGRSFQVFLSSHLITTVNQQLSVFCFVLSR